MSWDVVAFNYDGSPPADTEEMGEFPDPQPLGDAATVRDAVSRHLQGVDWSDETCGSYDGEGFSIEFRILGDEDPVTALMLHVYGGGDAIAALLQFGAPNKWSFLDCSTNAFIDPADPSQEGWEGFQEYRDKMVDDYRGDDEKT
jgi:hypothetical protein